MEDLSSDEELAKYDFDTYEVPADAFPTFGEEESIRTKLIQDLQGIGMHAVGEDNVKRFIPGDAPHGTARPVKNHPNFVSFDSCQSALCVRSKT